MKNERFQMGLKLILSHILLILGLLVTSFLFQKNDFSLLLIAQTLLLIIFFAGYWEFFGLRFKYLFCLAIEFIIISLFLKLFNHLNFIGNSYVFILLSILEVYLLFEQSKIFLVIFEKDRSGIEINFPFKNGVYLITDGGNSKISRLMNYHYYSPTHKKRNTNRSMLYATDIIKVGNDFKWLPKENKDYAIFEESVFSPINGTVIKVENNIADNKPYSGNYPYNTGNTVVIQKNKYYFLLGHLKQNSIAVKEGESVEAGSLIGLAGNSGWTERPHLHMQLIRSETNDYWKGIGIAINFNGRNLFKNRLLKIPAGREV